jgi:zinc protease
VKTTRPKKVRVLYGVTEYRLSNGLRVLFKRDRSAPVVAVCVTFHVGSRNEAKGHTGATHILEHLLFKDSEKFNKQNGKEITGYLDWLGAYVNATTWLDRTNYFEVLPKEHLGDALELEADRMRNSLFTDQDLASEMTVVRNEFERSRNNPFELLEEEVWKKAFTTHPYRIPTIGLKEDIESSTAAKLRDFYDKYYWPNNATLAVFGDATWPEVEKLVLAHFATIPSSPHPIPQMTTVEPKQAAARSVALRKPLGISIASLSFKIPQATHKDFPAVLVMGTILAGGFSSVLQKTLVDSGIASDLSLSLPPLRDPGLMSFTAHVAEGIKPQKAIRIMRAEIDAFMKSMATTAELARAKERLLTQIAYERDGVFIDIRAVSESIAAGDWALGYRVENLIKRVGPKDVQRVAKAYLAPSQETRGTLEHSADEPAPEL